eukprot:4978069-Amphidinium_carterae.1
MVTITNVSIMTIRRLEVSQASLRALTTSGGSVVIDYTIEAPLDVELDVNTSTVAAAMSETVQTALVDAGIAVNVTGVEVAEPIIVVFTSRTTATTSSSSTSSQGSSSKSSTSSTTSPTSATSRTSDSTSSSTSNT